MPKLLFAMCLVFLLGAPNAHSTQIIDTDKVPRIAVTPESWDFGKITESKTETHNFEVKNIGSVPLTIKGVTSSCGCTSASLSSLKIEPGETATLKVDVDSLQINSQGKIKRQVYIDSNDPKEPLKTVPIFLEINTIIDSKKHSEKVPQPEPISKVRPPPKISSRKLHSLVKAGRKIIVLDAREENEYKGAKNELVEKIGRKMEKIY